MTLPSPKGSTRIDIEVEAGVEGQRIDSYLGKHRDLNLTRTRAQKLIEAGLVLLNGEVVSRKHPVNSGDSIAISLVPPPATELKGEDIPLDIIFEDEYLAVINKPPGMVTHPGAGNYSGTLVNALIYHFKNLPTGSGPDRPGIVHRLDKDTSGLILIAKDENIYQKLQKAIQGREVKRTYLAVVCGHVSQDEGQIELPVGRSLKNRKRMAVTGVAGRQAITSYRLVKRYRSYDLLEINLLTGRTHQIRIHFSHLGHPVLGDPEYGGREKWHRGMFAPERPLGKRLLEIIKRQALHAVKLEFMHPVTGKTMQLKAEVPGDMSAALEMLESEGC
jgi:23S rRNA pseudouridine1911/1915/1917 synthase